MPVKKIQVWKIFFQQTLPILLVGFFILSGVAGFLLGAEASADESVRGDAFITASIGEPSNLIPFLAADSASATISSLIFDGLVKYDKDLRLVGELAKRWEIKEDGKVITFHLRQGVLWQDGRPFTAEDVEFTYQKLTDPNVPTPYGSDFQKVSSFRILDSHTIEITYEEPFSPGLASWTMGMVPKHLLAGEDLRTTSFSRQPVGTGPYQLKRWRSGEKIELLANPTYFDGEPPITRYVYRIIPDQATIFLELATENLDEAGLSPLQFKRQTDTSFFRRSYKKFRHPSFSYAYMAYNLKDPLFSDQRVRKALGLAINKKEIIDVVLLGFGQAATGPFLPGSWAHNPDIPAPEFNPKKALKLLSQAGWSDTDRDGFLDKEGEKFSFTILTNQGNEQRKMACEMIQKRLQEIGIQVKIQIIEWATFLKQHINPRDFQAVLLGWQLSPDPDIYDIFHSSKKRPGEFNFTFYNNPQVDQLLDEGRRRFAEGERAEVYHKIHEIISDEEPYTFLYVPDALPIVHRRFQGVEQGLAGLHHNFNKWFVLPEDQKYKR